MAVFVERYGEISRGSGDEFGCAGGTVSGGFIPNGAGYCVKGVCGEVSRTVEGEDDGEGLGDEEAVWAEKEFEKGGFDGLHQTAFIASVFYDGAGSIQSVLWSLRLLVLPLFMG